jgi:hypothetical protein
MSEHEIHERAAGLVEPDTLLPTQYFDRIRRGGGGSGERRLMTAIIEDAVQMYLKHARARDGLHGKLFADAEQWIESEDRTWVFSFETICDYLGLDSAYLRRGLRAHKRRAAAAPAEPDIVPREVDEESPRRRAGNE